MQMNMHGFSGANLADIWATKLAIQEFGKHARRGIKRGLQVMMRRSKRKSKRRTLFRLTDMPHYIFSYYVHLMHRT
jgi:hypothetical protein